MFNTPISPAQNILLVISVLAYVAGMTVGRHDPTPERRFTRWGKLIMVACFVVIAAISISETPAGPARLAAWLILAGLVLGGIGDSILADLIPLKHPLVPGIGVFALGHLAYSAAIIVLSQAVGWQPGLTIGLVLGSWAVSGVLWHVVVRVSTAVSRRVQVGILVYALLLTGVMAASWALAASSAALIVLALGLTVFVISDVLLVLDIADGWRFPLIGDVVWIMYAAGQTAIAVSPLLFAGALN